MPGHQKVGPGVGGGDVVQIRVAGWIEPAPVLGQTGQDKLSGGSLILRPERPDLQWLARTPQLVRVLSHTRSFRPLCLPADR